MKGFKLTVLFSLLFFAAQAQNKSFIDQPYLETAGDADTMVAPNEIFIKISISEKDTKDRISVEELELKMYNALKLLGINVDKNLTTSDMASNFRYYLLKTKDVIKSKQYILKVGDAVTAGKVFIELENLGISNAAIDHVEHSDLTAIKNILRSRAIENAKTRALALTKPLNQSLGAAIHITDNENYGTSTNIKRMRLEQMAVSAYDLRKQSATELPKIEFEKIRVITHINVKFILKP